MTSKGGNSSVVECDLAKVEVAGSNPVSRSILRSQGISGATDGEPTLPRRQAKIALRSGAAAKEAPQNIMLLTRCSMGQ